MQVDVFLPNHTEACGIAAAWAADVRVLGKAAALDAPIFRRSARGGVADAVETADVRAAVRAAVRAVGESAADFGAHSLRIGPATDMRDLLGVEADLLGVEAW